jgi:hypothetical protein
MNNTKILPGLSEGLRSSRSGSDGDDDGQDLAETASASTAVAK